MGHVYTARVRIRHHEVDAFGRATPATHLRLLAQVAIDASSDAGFDAAWYAAAGGHWLVRRSTFTLHRQVRADVELVMQTWVEDFRRVLSARRYEVRTAAGDPVVDAVTDWVYVDARSGRVRRIPDAFEQRLGASTAAPAGGTLAPRPPFRQPRPPAGAARSRSRVRWSDLDALAHVNNAAYLDLLAQAVLDALEARGWPVARLAGDGAAPAIAGGDLEYLGAAVYGEDVEALTWFTSSSHGLETYQRLQRADDGRVLVQANTTWRWLASSAGEPMPLPSGLADAVSPLAAA